jgi:hypothetical protein
MALCGHCGWVCSEEEGRSFAFCGQSTGFFTRHPRGPVYLIREREPQRYMGNVVGREKESPVVKYECGSERPENFRSCVARSLISKVISRQSLESLACRTNSVDCSVRRIQSVAKLETANNKGKMSVRRKVRL